MIDPSLINQISWVPKVNEVLARGLSENSRYTCIDKISITRVDEDLASYELVITVTVRGKETHRCVSMHWRCRPWEIDTGRGPRDIFTTLLFAIESQLLLLENLLILKGEPWDPEAAKPSEDEFRREYGKNDICGSTPKTYESSGG